jgi:multisubunit Na+/H+ antiporter MnhE subunit
MSRDRKYRKSLITFLLVIIITLPAIFCSCKSADFEVSNLVIKPADVLTGTTVTVTVDVTNTGGSEGTYDIVLLVNGENESSKEITLASETTETVQFLLSKDTPGTYSIEVAELNGTLTVFMLDQLLEKTATAMSNVDSYHFSCAIELEISIPEDSFSFFEDME